MALDTRGLMDGALKGFQVMDGYYRNQASLKDADERMQMAKESHDIGMKNAEKQGRLVDSQLSKNQADMDRLYGLKDATGKRAGGWLQAQQNLEQKRTKSQVAANNSRIKLNNYQIEQQEKSQYIKDNTPVLEQKWEDWVQTGTRDEMFNNKYIKGSAYDPQRYLDKEHDSAFQTLERTIPGIIKNPRTIDDETISALGTIYQDQVKRVVGQQDPITGKTIKNAKLGNIHLAGDIDPNQPGDQPGVVLTTLVDYGDGKWAVKPITQNRSTDPNDPVMVIPVERIMTDLTGQMKKWRIAKTAESQRKLFSNQGKGQQAITKQFNDAVIKLNEKRQEQIATVLSPDSDEGKNQIAAINAAYTQSKNEVQSLLYGQSSKGNDPQIAHDNISVPQWANGDPDKLSFARALQKSGYNVGSMTIKDLDDAWKTDNYAKQKKRDQAEKTAKEREFNNQLVNAYRNVGQSKPVDQDTYSHEMASEMSRLGQR